MKLNLNKNLKDLDGKEIINTNMGKLLGNFLASNNGDEPIKFLDLALRLYRGEDVVLDDIDYKKIYTEIEKSTQLTRLVKAQILKELETQKK